MGLLGGIMRSVVNPATLFQVAMGPAGWASLAVRTIGSAIGQQLIQQLGQRLGLPQGVISMAQNALSAATGTQGGPANIASAVAQVAQQLNLSPMQHGELQRSAQNVFDGLLENMMSSQEFKEAKASGGKSWLMAIAQTLGNKTDAMADDLTERASKLGGNAQSKDNLEYAAKSQEFSMLFNAANSALKTLGEALQSAARKQ